MARVIILKRALADLEKLYAYIRERDGGAANAGGFVQRIRAGCEALSLFPERGTKRDDIRPGLRIMSVERRVVIAFEVRGDVVTIARVFYGGRNYEELLKRR